MPSFHSQKSLHAASFSALLLIIVALADVGLAVGVVAALYYRLEGGVAAAFALVGAGILAIALEPEVALGIWGVVIVLFVVWPGQAPPYAPFHLSIEYLLLLLALGVVCVSAFLRRRLLWQSLPRPLLTIAAGLIAYSSIAYFWSVDHVAWAEYLAMWAIYLAVFFSLSAAVAAMDERRLAAVLEFLAWASAAVGVFGVFRTAGAGMIARQAIDPWALFSPFIRFRVSEDLILLVGFAIALYLARHGKARHVLLVIILAASIVLSLSRTGIVGLAVMSVLAIPLILPSARRLWIAAAIALALLALCGLLAVLGFAPAVTIADRLSSISVTSDIWLGRLNPDDLGAGRQLLLNEAFRIIALNPSVGTGPGNYMAHFDRSIPTTATTPHNTYLLALAEGGILGATLLFAFWAYLTLFVWRAARRVGADWRVLMLALSSMNVALLVMGLAAEFFNTPYLWFFFALAVGLAMRAAPSRV